MPLRVTRGQALCLAAAAPAPARGRRRPDRGRPDARGGVGLRLRPRPVRTPSARVAGRARGGAARPHRRPADADVLLPRVGPGDGARDRRHLPRAPVGRTAVGAEELGRALPARCPTSGPTCARSSASVVAAGPVPPQAVADELAGHQRFAHLAKEFAEPNHTLLKPLRLAGRHRARPRPRRSAGAAEPRRWHPAWAGIPDLDEAGAARRPRVRRRLRPDHARARRPLARRRAQRRPVPAGAVVARGRGPARRGRRRRRGALGPRRRRAELADVRPEPHGGAAARQGRLGDGAGHQGHVGRAPRAPHRR